MIRNNLSFHTPTGRPQVISDKQGRLVAEQLRNEGYLEHDAEYEKKLQTAVDATLCERTGSHASAGSISRRTKGRFEKKFDIISAKAEVSTDARVIATASVRNAVSFVTMNALVNKDYSVHPSLKVNADATAFTICSGCNRTEKVKMVRGRVTSKQRKKTVQAKAKPSTLPYTLKVYVLISAGGAMAPPVYIVPDEAMDKDTTSATWTRSKLWARKVKLCFRG